jgi:glyoxylase-like metal-dependent hydrolase (beta-lactamase superfamily II)
MYSMTEFLTRHDDILTIVTVIDDPIYLDQPYIHSTTYTVAQGESLTTEVCNGSFAENGGTDRHWVPHFLPGSNTEALTEWLTKGDPRTAVAGPPGGEDWVPLAAARGGVKTLYPEYRSTLDGATAVESRVANLAIPIMRSVVSASKKIADQSPRDGEVHVLPVQGNVYVLVADGTNITASVGPEGIALVNTGGPHMSDKILATVSQLAQIVVGQATTNRCVGATCPGVWGWSSPYIFSAITSPPPTRPIRYIVNTSASTEHVGGNEKIAAAGTGMRGGGLGGAIATVEGAPLIAHENVLNRMSAPAGKEPPSPQRSWPTVSYFDEFYKFPAYFNGEGVTVYHTPAANTDGDSIVWFRRSEVISAGDIFSTVSYPAIDIARGGSVDGVIAGLNRILDLSFAEYRSQGGTWIIPSHGRLSDTADVASYRNMVVMIRDRVQDLIDKGMTLAQVKAARPSADFDGRYGVFPGAQTGDSFIEAVYRSLQEKK